MAASSVYPGQPLGDAPLGVVPTTLPPPPAPSSPFIPGPLASLHRRFSQWRSSLGLPNPGTADNLHKEVNNTHLTNFIFDGARAQLAKTLSAHPYFQVTHSFTLASQTAPPSYGFGTVFAHENTFVMQGQVDHDGSVSVQLNQVWSETNGTRVQAQLSATQPQHNVLQLEQDYQGSDYSLNLKAVDPSPADLTGIYVGRYLQSFTKNLALGVETVWQRQTPIMQDISTSYLAKYTGGEKDWIASATLQPAGMLQAAYWQKLNEKVQFAADLTLIAAPTRRHAVATLGAKYDLRMSTFRAQVDSTGKVSALLEQKFAPTFSFLVAGEIDHFKNAAKVGVGVVIESSSLTPEEMGLSPQPM